MQYFKARHKNKKKSFRLLLPLLAGLISISCCFTAKAQSCPPNIDFETGTFNGWTCYTGYTAAVGDQNVISLTPSGGPVFNKHTMYTSNTGELDPFGRFPVSCPNGSGHSIKLGSTTAGGEAEGISYQFTIPANENSYSILYNYAVVFQSPNHRINEQPRMEIEVTNITDNTIISCASFSFIAVGSSLPGFEVSTYTDSTTVLYKNWSAVSVDLSGNAGKTIRMFFKTADCTFRRHFGYAYIDVNSECSGDFVGATYCPDDSVINIRAPFGYQSYTWYDSALNNILGTQQTLSLPPFGVPGRTVAVKLEPYDGYGCPQTLFARLKDSLVISANAGRDTLSCNLTPVPIGTFPKGGLVYTWSPTAGLSNPDIANPLAAPGKTTTYIVTTNNSGGGCRTKDTVVVRASVIDTSLQLFGKPAFCFGHGDSAILKVQTTENIQWFKDDIALSGVRQTTYRVVSGGTYYALLSNAAGCRISTPKQTIVIEKEKPGISYPTEYAIINLPLPLEARQIGDSVLWKPATSLNSPATFTPTFLGVFEQLYTIEIRTNAGCLTVDTQLVKTVKGVEIYIPSAFTPNKDGINDFFRPILRGVKEVRYFRVFSRWGQLLFESENETSGWDGTYKGIPQDSQAIVWMLQCIGIDGRGYARKGTSVLLR
ncbi:MAG: T9SS type B sorting domain-containing protein [Ginsengibacter sp.]